MSEPMPGGVVAFDFDGTLTRGDSLLPFLRVVLGTSGLLLAILKSLPWLAGFALRLVRNDVAKQALLRAALAGRAAADVNRAAERYADTLDARLRPEAMQLIEQHRHAGQRLLLVSASLNCYLEPWARRQGFEAVLSSDLEVDAQGLLTGRLSGANCHGEEKVRRLAGYLGGATALDCAYGDSRGDKPMLKLARMAYYKGRPWQGD